jgi:PrgI family protein
MRVRIPVDVDMADRIFAGLTARQLAILGGHALVLALLYGMLGERVPLPLLGAIALPIACVGLLWATTSAQGATWERMALSAIRHLARPRRRVLAPEGVPSSPSWAGDVPSLAPIEFPVHDASPDGRVDLGDEGVAAICRASSVNFALRSETEQQALVEGFARLLNALDAPVQFLVRSNRVDLRSLVGSIDEAAGGLPHPALETAAREHADFLRSLGGRRDALSRQVLISFRQPDGADESSAGLGHRIEEAGALLRGIGVRLVRQEGAEISALLASAADPEAEPPHQGARSSGVVEGSW